MNDLFGSGQGKQAASDSYSAKDIEVLEGLEPVRRRPGMYIGGTGRGRIPPSGRRDHRQRDGRGGRGSCVVHRGGAARRRVAGGARQRARHSRRRTSKFKTLSALEVILTTLHSGGKFGGDAYETSGGLHGVGSSVVNALSETLEVEVARDRVLWRQTYARGKPTSKLVQVGAAPNRRGTTIRFKPDPQISAAALLAAPAIPAVPIQSVSVPRRRDPLVVRSDAAGRERARHRAGRGGAAFPGRAARQPRCRHRRRLAAGNRPLVWARPTCRRWVWRAGRARRMGGVRGWNVDDGFLHSYCNTVPTAQGGTHEAGFRGGPAASGLRAWGEQRGQKRDGQRSLPRMCSGGLAAKLSAFLRDPQFPGQTKERLTSPDAATADRDWRCATGSTTILAGDPAQADSAARLRGRARRGASCAAAS